jgi:two-component system, OmpR family, KDP operon response regulator KdpE
VDNETTLLVIDDDPRFVSVLSLFLVKSGYRVLSAGDGLEGLQQLYSQRPDLVILDVMMPNLDGWETCRRIREVSAVPIIMLTAKGAEAERILGLKLGADDYICKPFSMPELAARVSAVLRRARGGEPEKPKLVQVDDDLVVDIGKFEVRRQGQAVDLTSTELRLICYLAENANRLLTHRQILENIWGSEYVDEPDYVKLFMWRLRRKIEPDPRHLKYLITERGIGYRFCTFRGSPPVDGT